MAGATGGTAAGDRGRDSDAEDPFEPDPDAADDFDLARIASNLRRVMPRVDEASRVRLEAAWVSLTNAVKQPQVDADRLRRRLRRLRSELDSWLVRFNRDEKEESVGGQGIPPAPADPRR
ncbi:MAG TPA: hypothetical protein PLB21_01075 [Actinomycetota bacterium]|nr:hypothetical protein [Actinomycetota bacterium]